MRRLLTVLALVLGVLTLAAACLGEYVFALLLFGCAVALDGWLHAEKQNDQLRKRLAEKDDVIRSLASDNPWSQRPQRSTT